jgi:hypothetical protein
MSLFADDRYRWRETYFVLFQEADRPSLDDISQALRSLGAGYQVTDVHKGKDGEFESLTMLSPNDFSAMDISYVSGEEVLEQVAELCRELKRGTDTTREQALLEKLADCTVRFDVYHFQQVSMDVLGAEDEDEFMDPGTLLLVLKRLAKLCHGIALDPQSGSLM